MKLNLNIRTMSKDVCDNDILVRVSGTISSACSLFILMGYVPKGSKVLRLFD